MPRRGPIRPWMITLVVLLLVAVAAAFSTKVVSTEQAQASTADKFDPATYASDHFDKDVVPYVEDNAQDLAPLVTALNGGADEAQYGNTSGASSAYAFPVTFTATAGAPTPPTLPLTVEGIPEGTTVVLQVGPALNGTALRDVSGTVSFNDFKNQLEYQQVGTEFNNLVKSGVLADLDVASLEGKQLKITGAFLRVNPALVSVVPTSVEVIQ
jgi:predicted lipoprotein